MPLLSPKSFDLAKSHVAIYALQYTLNNNEKHLNSIYYFLIKLIKSSYINSKILYILYKNLLKKGKKKNRTA